MNKKNPKALGKLKTFLAVTLSCSMVLGVVAVADALYPTKDNEAKAATTSSVLGASTAAGLTKISVGDTIQFPGVAGVNGQTATAKACKTNDDGSIEMVFENVGTHGTWPGQNYSAAASSWGDTTQNFQSTYSYAVLGNYYLLPTSNPNDNEKEALKTAAGIYSSFGTSYNAAWLGTPYDSSHAYFVDSNGNVYNSSTSNDFVLAPAFNLKASYAWKIGNSFAKNVGGSAAISATQSKTSVNSWETTAVTSIITNVTNGVTGTTDKYTVDSNLGYMNGSNYIPTVRSDTVTDTLTVRSVDNAGFTAKTFSLTVVGADVQVTSDTLEAGTSYDLSFVASSKTDGMVITDTQNWISGDKYIVPGSARDLTDTFKFTIGNTLIASKDVKIKANQNIQMDDEGYYIYTDDNNIEWHFKYNDAGQIDYLFASSANIGKLVTNDESKTLTVPSTINGVTVAGIGTDGSSHNFLNDTDGATGSTVWKNIYIPSSVKTIRGYAFAGCKASAKVEIPSTVQAISKHAFDGSSITEVKFDDASKLTIGEEAFANNTNLTSVILRGNGCSIGKKAFYGTGITKLNIPSGTTFGADSNAFSHNEALAELKVDMTTVPDNSFVDTPALAKVTFGENVKQVNALWTGKKAEASGTIANRTTYALGADTIFNCSKANESTYYSPFGIGGTLNVYGLKSEQVFNNGSGPVYAFNNGANNAYAKGEADSEETHICTTTSSMDGLGDSDVTDQTGIEASYSGTLLGGSNATTAASTLNKDNMTVRKLFGEDANGTYSSDEFYVMRSQTFDDEVKGKSFSGYTTEGNVNTIKDSDTMLEFYKSVDKVQVNDTDVSNGALTVTVVVLKTAEYDGKTYYLASQQKDGSAKMDIFTCEVTIPVKKYSDYNLFSDVYGGDFTKIAQAITDAQTKNEKLQSELDEQIKTAQATQAQLTKAQADLAEVNDKLAEANNQNTQLTTEKESLSGEIETLNSKLAAIKEAAGTDDVDTLKAMKATSDTYGDFLTTYKDIVDKVKNGESLTEDDIIALGGNAVIEAYKKQITDKQTQIDTDKKNIADMQSRIDSLSAENTKLSADLEEAKSNVTKLENDNTATKTELDNAKAQVTELETTISENKATISELNENIADAQAEIEQANTDKEKVQEALTKAQENVKTLSEQNDKLTSEKDKIEAALKAAGQSVDDAAASITSLKKNLDDMTASNEKQTSDIKALNEQISSLNSEITSLEKKVEDYKKANETLATLAGIDVSGKDSVQIQAALKEVINTYIKDREAIQQIANAAGVDPTEATKDPTTLVDKIKNNSSNTHSGNSGNSSSCSDSATVSDLKAQLASAQANATTYKTQADTYKSLYDSLSAQNAQNSGTNSTLTQQITTLSAKVSSLTSENSDLSDKNSSLSTENQTLNAKNKSLSDQNDSLTSENKSLSDKNSSLSKKNSTLTSTNKSLESKNKTLTTKNKALTSSNKSLKEQVSSLKNQTPKTVTKTVTKEVPKVVYRDSASSSTSSTTSSSTDSKKSDSGSTTIIGGTGNTTSTDKDKDSDKSDKNVDAEKQQYEASIPSGNPGYVSTLVSSDFSSVTDDSVKDSGSTVNELDKANSYVTTGGFTTNCESVTDTTDEQKKNANSIFKYYAANPSLLTNLGVSGLDATTDDNSKIAVQVDGLLSLDLNPSDEQKKAIDSGEGADVNITGDGITFDDGSQYLVVHESTERAGTFDTLVVNASNNALDFNLEDLSPVAIAKISVVTVPVSDSSVSAPETESAPEVTSSNSGLKNIFKFFAIIALLLGGVFVILLKTHVINLNGNARKERSTTDSKPSSPRI